MTSEWAARNPKDSFAILEKKCAENGYKWSGLSPAPCDWRKLVDSKAVESLVKLLTEELDDAPCDVSETVTAIKLDIVDTLDKPNWKARVGIVTGCPGSGKSTLIRQLLDDRNQDCRAVLGVPYKSLLTGVYAGRMNVFLIDDLMTSEIEYSQYATMLVDEFTRVHMCEVLVLACLLGVRNVILFGDPAQGMNYKSGSVVNYNFPILADSNVSRRFGKETANLVNKCSGGGRKISGDESIKDAWKFEDRVGKIPDDTTVLTASRKTQSDLRDDGIESMVWSDVQGQTFEKVTLVLDDDNDNDEICNPNAREVLLTRAREGGSVMCDPNISARFSNGDFSCKDGCCSHTGDTVNYSRW